MNLIWILTILFVFITLGVGVWGMKRSHTLSDFFIGGRSLGPWVSAFTYGTSYYSAVMFIGFAGQLGWGFGLDVLWISFGNTFFGCMLAWLVLGRRTRRMTQNLGVMTMPEFFDRRLNAPLLKIFAAVVIFLFLLPYSAAAFTGLAYLFKVTLGIDFAYALIGMCLVTAIYLIMGGYHAMSLNDFIQGMVMLIGSILMFVILLGKAGGFQEAISTIQTNYPAHLGGKLPPWYLIAAATFVTSFGVWGLPQMVQKFYAIKDEKQIFRAMLVTTLFSFIVVFAGYFNGSMMHIFYTNPAQVSSVEEAKAYEVRLQKETGKIGEDGRIIPVPAPYLLNEDGSQKMKNGTPVIAYDELVPRLLQSQLPPALMAIIVVLVLSATMSTLSSLILVSSSAIAIDLYKEHAHLDESSQKPLYLIRFLNGLFILISVLMALLKFSFIVTMMSLSWGAVAGAFMAPYLYSLYWKRLNKYGAAAGMLTGLTLNIILFALKVPSTIAASAAILVPFAVIPVVTLLTPAPQSETVALAFAKPQKETEKDSENGSENGSDSSAEPQPT